MEKPNPHEQYRDDLAQKLKDIRNDESVSPEKARGKAEGYLEAQKETEEYQKAKGIHEAENNISIKGLEENFKDIFNEHKITLDSVEGNEIKLRSNLSRPEVVEFLRNSGTEMSVIDAMTESKNREFVMYDVINTLLKEQGKIPTDLQAYSIRITSGNTFLYIAYDEVKKKWIDAHSRTIAAAASAIY